MFTSSVLLIAALAIIAAVAAGYLLSRTASNLPRVQLVIGDARIEAELAVSMVARMQGLSGRTSLEEGKGMFFSFGSARTQSFWMRDMHFPIDIVWIRDGVVVGVTADVDPQIGAHIWQLRTYTSPEPADEVLELPAGYAATNGIVTGSRVVVQPIE